ncbi:MAG TPA: Fe2+-dependent dioxygenase [Oleiagrimonas sp.]|nr:Fe2+-dependent dioxygenase [Oleiagrimonas sp.]
MLIHVPEVLDAAQTVHVRETLQAAEWSDGRETVGPQGARVKRNQQLPDASSTRRELGAIVLEALARNSLYHAATLPQKTLPPRFNRYQGGEQYGFHVDGSIMAMPDNAGQLRSDIACSLFLNEPDAYDGGELVISDTYGEHEVKLPAGDLVVYPASSLHRVTPVTRGTRLAAFFWVQSLIRDDAQRRMLFELDASIRQLDTGDTGRAVTLQLTAVYHNLLRMWAQT